VRVGITRLAHEGEVSCHLRAVESHGEEEAQRRCLSAQWRATILQDYAAVRPLMADLLATASELKVAESMAQTVTVVRDGADTVAEVAVRLELDRTAAWRRHASKGHLRIVATCHAPSKPHELIEAEA
jgi:hypothetical protein